MKTLITYLLAALVGTALAQTEEPGKTTQIVFVPHKTLGEIKTSGKLKENTFYWGYKNDNPDRGDAGTGKWETFPSGSTLLARRVRS